MLHLGCAWYPEHWSAQRWPRDCELMQQAGMTVVRIGEFAWSRMEPADGRIELDWLAAAVDCAAAHDLGVVLCTPTPTPPAWLTRQHPDILPQRHPGDPTVQLHGQRGHYDPANQTYRQYCRRIVTALAVRFGHHDAVLGWQTDNEFWSICTNPATMAAFRAWLRQRYGSLTALNEAWSTSFWSQEYFDWEDIQPPMEYPNPGLHLAWHRFHGDLLHDFQAEQITILRERCEPRQWVTHNFHPYDEFDRCQVSRDLDLVSWDAYVTGEQLALDVAASALDCETLRGIKHRNIWIMETLPGFVNWRPINRHFEPGETRAMAWHLLGHGSDAVLYWQWRSAPTNQEQYHGSLIHQDGEPRPVYQEIARFGGELRRLDEVLDGTVPASDVAIVNRWCDRQALKRQPHHRDYVPRDRVADVYRAWQRAGHAPNALPALATDLAAWRMIVAPHLHLLDDDEADHLRRWVIDGGHLVLGPRSGMKDGHNRLRPERQPGPLAELLGASVTEFYALPEPLPIRWTERTDAPSDEDPDSEPQPSGQARIFAEWLRPDRDDCQVLARYGPGNGWLSGQAAVVSRPAGAGRVSCFACCGDAAFHAQLIARLLQLTPCDPLLPDPLPGIEVCRRRGPEQDLLLLINHSGSEIVQPIVQPARDILGKKDIDDAVSLGPYDIAVLAIPQPESTSSVTDPSGNQPD